MVNTVPASNFIGISAVKADNSYHFQIYAITQDGKVYTSYNNSAYTLVNTIPATNFVGISVAIADSSYHFQIYVLSNPNSTPTISAITPYQNQ